MINLKSLQTFIARLSKKEKILFYGAAIFIFLVLLDKAVITPSVSKMKSQDDEIREKKLIIKKDIRILALKNRIEEEHKKYEGYFSKIGSLEEERTSMLKEIENLASENAVYLVYVRPGEMRTEGPFKNLLVNLNCEGEMPQVVSFLYSIENSTKLLTIEKYVISPKAEGSSIAQCRITVSKILMP